MFILNNEKTAICSRQQFQIFDCFFKNKLEDLKVLRRSPDLFNP